MGTQYPSPKRGPSPIFGPFIWRPNGSMHQDATWYGCWPQPKELCVRWRPSLPSQQRGRSPLPFLGPFLLCPNGRMIKMPLGMEVSLIPSHIVLDGDPALRNGHSTPFWLVPVVAERSPISATAEHLSNNWQPSIMHKDCNYYLRQ